MSANLLLSEPPLQVLPSLAEAIGLNEAIFLQQLHYNITPRANYIPEQRELDGKLQYWFYCPYDTKKKTKNGHIISWKAIFPFWGLNTIKRIVTKLRKMNIIVSTDTFNESPWQRKLWYTIDYDALDDWLNVHHKRPSPLSQNGTVNETSLGRSDSTNMGRSEIDLKETQEIDLKECADKKQSAGAPVETSSNPSELTDKQKNKHSAIQAFRHEAHSYPRGSWKNEVIDKVGDDPEDLEFWQEVVKAYVGTYPNPTNVKAMLEHYERREIPTTSKGKRNGAYTNGRTNRTGSQAISNIGEQDDTFGPTRTIF